MFVDVTKVFIL